MATINGSLNGNDRLRGTSSSDTMNGFGGDDWFYSSRGSDSINGGAGIDTVDFSASGQSAYYEFDSPIGRITTPFNGVYVDLNAGAGYWGDALGDTYSGIENLLGSAYNDALGGDQNANAIHGAAGNDLIEGRGGADNLDGGTGVDTLSYSMSGAFVKVDLLANTASGGEATGDVIRNFENLTGSGHADLLSGSNGANRIDGGNGDDTISGRGGADQLFGGRGNDTIDGGSDNDTIEGGSNNDTMTGGAGADNFVFRAADANAGIDHITDFDAGQDRILIDVTPGTIMEDVDVSFNGTHDTATITYQLWDGATGTIVLEDVSGSSVYHILSSIELI